MNTTHPVVSKQEWLEARRGLLAAEKELTRKRDEVSRRRRELPWERVEKEYVFEGPKGRETFADLFRGRHQLIVYHFMLGPQMSQGCKSCSFVSDHFDGTLVHLAQRDVSLVAISRAPWAQIAEFRKRMGWRFHWVSASDTTFPRDYGVHFTKEETAGEVDYNYGKNHFPSEDAPGFSVFYKDDSGEIFHTYSVYSRGIDMMMGTYHLLDLVPKGRDEAGLPHTMAWVRHHDRYDPIPEMEGA
ncbi:MAG: thioredoxin family protein [Bryobacteraceae bacterium]